MDYYLDPVVNEECIDTNGELIDQIMDIMQTGGTFTIDGVHSNLLIRRHMADVFDCIQDLETQGLVQCVGDDPPCWRAADTSQTQINTENSPPYEEHMEWNTHSEEKPTSGENQSNFPKLPMHVSSSVSNTAQPSMPNHSHNSLGAVPPQHSRSQSNAPAQSTGGPPPPPHAILSQSNQQAAFIPIPRVPVGRGRASRVNNPGLHRPQVRPSAPYSPEEERSAFMFNSQSRGLNPGRSQNNTQNVFSAQQRPGQQNIPGFPGARSTSYNQPTNTVPQPSMQHGSGFTSYNHPTNTGTGASEQPRLQDSNGYKTGFPSGHTGIDTGKTDASPSQTGFGSGQTNFPSSQTSFPHGRTGPTNFQSSQNSSHSSQTGQTSFQPSQTSFPPAQTSSASNPFPRPPTAEMFQNLANQGPQKIPAKSASSTNTRSINLTSLQRQLLDSMVKANKPCETLQLARSCGVRTKKEVNPSLYQLQTWGLVSKMHDKPPTWKLRSDNMQLINSLTGSSSPSGNLSSMSPANFTSASNRPNTDSNRPINPFGKRNLSTEDFSIQKVPHFENQTNFSKGFPQVQGFSQGGGGAGLVDQGNQHQALSNIVHSSINKNPVSALNEYAQKNRLELSYETFNEKRGFAVAVVLGGQMFPAARASNSKDARREACDVALRCLLGQNLGGDAELNVNQPSAGALQGARTHFDLIAALSQHAFVQIAATIDENIAGRKVVACFVMKQGPGDTGKVVSVGSGNRCVTGERLSMEGKVVNDSHAEIVARRSLHRFLYAQIQSFYDGQESVFEQRNSSSLLSLKAGVSFHLYISTAPCGDGALFTPRVDDVLPQPQSEDGSHSPEFTSKTQGILRTKIEDGEGTIPIDPSDGTQTWDGLLRGQRLRTMSCSDKICRWNVVGLQGALLTHFIEPVYLASLTLGYLYDHGHLSRAVCCRLQHKIDLGTELSIPFKVNHPLLGRVTAYEASRHTEKTNNLSVNWSYGDTSAEVVDGRTGACLSRTRNQPTPARICKAALYDLFKGLCAKTQRRELLSFDTYREAKSSARQFQEAKRLMFECFRKSKYGSWVSKPAEQEMF